MKKIFMTILLTIAVLFLFNLNSFSKGKGEKCVNDSQCDFGLSCEGGVCIKEKAYDFGSSGKTGNRCNVDSDCIGSGKCVEGSFGKKYCSGN